MSARRRLLVAAAVVLVPLPAIVALTDPHLDAAPVALVSRPRPRRSRSPPSPCSRCWPAAAACAGTGSSAPSRSRSCSLHLGGLFVVGAEDTLFALSLDGPTRGRMATLATVALIAVVALGVARARLPMSGPTWRILHGFLAVLVIGLGFGHAILTDGALDGFGTAVLLAFATVALLGVAPPTRLGPGGRQRSHLQQRPPR